MQNKYKLHENGLAAVEAIKGPVAVVSVAGLYRTGKSYLLNRLLDRQSGFDVGPTINPCTKGIYVWGAPIKSPTMGDVNIILIDTEGLGSFDASATHDVKIFSLAILLSSYFIYNSMGTIDENALDKLSLVTHLTEHIQLRTAGKGSKEAEANIFAKYFPRFLWVVRDFSLQLKDESNNTISETEYLERALSEKHGSRSEEKNAIRKAIKKFFPNRDCVTLVRPVESEQKLQSIDKTPYKELRDEFKKKMDSLRNRILNEVEPKRDGSSGAVISGAAWAALVRKYVEALNKGAVPNISDSWASVVLKEGQRAVDEAVAALVAALPKDVAREEEWEQAKLRARAAALDAFRATAIGNEEDVAPHRQAFEQRAEKELKEAETRIRGNARAVAQAALDMAFAAWMEKVRAGVIKDPTAVPGEWDTVARKAIAGLKGLVTEHKAVLSDFTHNKLPLAMAAVHNQVQQAHMKRQEELMAQISAKEKALTEEAKKGAEEARKAADESRKAAAAEAKLEIEKERAARSGEDNKRLNEEVKELKEARKRLETEKTLLTQKVSQLAAELEALKAERDAARAAANEHQTTSARSQHELRTELHALQAKLKERDAEATRRAKEAAEKDKAIDLLGATKTGLEAEIAALSAKSAEAGAAAQRAKQKDELLATQERRITALETELAAARALLASAASVPHAPAAAAAAAAAPMVNALPVVAVSEADEGEDESEAKKPGKRGRSPAAGAAKRSKNAKGEKATPAAGDNAEEVYSALTVPQLKAVLIDANVKPPIGKVSKGELVALCVENDAKCRAHVKN